MPPSRTFAPRSPPYLQACKQARAGPPRTTPVRGVRSQIGEDKIELNGFASRDECFAILSEACKAHGTSPTLTE